MFEVIQKYRTADGKEHDTAKKAAQHVEDRIYETFDKIARTAKNITAADAYNIALAMYENRAEIRAALDFETYGDDGKEEQ